MSKSQEKSNDVTIRPLDENTAQIITASGNDEYTIYVFDEDEIETELEVSGKKREVVDKFGFGNDLFVKTKRELYN